jgi:hypothetical protein
MGGFYSGLIAIAAGVIAYGIIASFVAARALVKHADREYKKMYEEHVVQKRRVEDRLKMARDALTEKH